MGFDTLVFSTSRWLCGLPTNCFGRSHPGGLGTLITDPTGEFFKTASSNKAFMSAVCETTGCISDVIRSKVVAGSMVSSPYS